MPTIAIVGTDPELSCRDAPGRGTLLYATGAGCLPVPVVASVNAAGALRNWVINLHKQLADSGIHAAHVAIGVSLGAVRPRIPDRPCTTKSLPSTGSCPPTMTKPSASSPPPSMSSAPDRPDGCLKGPHR